MCGGRSVSGGLADISAEQAALPRVMVSSITEVGLAGRGVGRFPASLFWNGPEDSCENPGFPKGLARHLGPVFGAVTASQMEIFQKSAKRYEPSPPTTISAPLAQRLRVHPLNGDWFSTRNLTREF